LERGSKNGGATGAETPPAGIEPSVRLDRVSKHFGDLVAVRDLDLDIGRGKFFTLLGPSGCGKTTTLRCIAGFETPSAGDVLVEGRSIAGRPPHRRDVGLVFQNYALFPHLTVGDNVAFGLRLRRRPAPEIARRVHDALSLVDLGGLDARYPRQLSGGQQQRIALARCLALEPSLLLLDEPLSNLDLKLRLQMRTELKKLQRRLGKTTLYVTHDQGEALALSDRIVVMSRGHVEQIGTPREIYESPRTRFVADFIGASNLLAGTIVSAGATGVTVRAGALELRSTDRTPAGATTVTVLIRPERIRLATAPPHGEDVNRLAVRVAEVAYLGEDLQVLLELDGGPTLSASLKATSVEKDWVPGTALTAWIAIDDVRLLPVASEAVTP
jgi:spermidine/putrescine ABC transporter ATP-binding subunit